MDDVQYQDMLKQPVEEAKRIYKRIGGEWTPEIEEATTTWLAENKREK